MLRDPEDDAIKRIVISSRSAAGHTLRVKLGEAGFELLQEGEEADAGPEAREVIKLLTERGPLYPREVATALNKPSGTVRVMLHRICKRDLISIKGGRYCAKKSKH